MDDNTLATPQDKREDANDWISRLMETLGGHAHADLVYGTPVEHGNVTVIPVAKVRWGFGFGRGRGKPNEGDGAGGGGGIAASPVGYIEIREGQARFRRLGPSPVLATLILALIASVGMIVRASRKQK